MPLGGIFDFDIKNERLIEVLLELENPKIWDSVTVLLFTTQHTFLSTFFI